MTDPSAASLIDSLSIVIPAYNEIKRLPSTLERLKQFLGTQRFTFLEVLVVDDGSRDGTAELVEREMADFPELRLVRNPANRGKGYTVRHGMLEARGDWILFTDADLSSPIDELAKLACEVRKSRAAVAIGSRALNRKLIGVHQSAFREYSGRVFNFVMSLVTGLPFLDTQCGFKLYRNDAAKQIFPRQILDGFSFDVEDLFIAHRLGLKIVEVPVVWNDVEGTKVSLRHGLQSFSDLLLVRWYAMQGRYS